MEVTITERTKIKRASATRRHGTIWVTLPRHWSKKLKNEATVELVQKIIQGEKRQEKILQSPEAQGPRLILINQAELEIYVAKINAETFDVPINKVRMGQSRYSRLAQMNIKNRTMTVSRYCLHNVPESALRYLIIHELAHCFEGSHNQKFWSLVQEYVPDYRKQSRVMKAFHNQAVSEAEASETPKEMTAIKTSKTQALPKKKPFSPLGFIQQINLF